MNDRKTDDERNIDVGKTVPEGSGDQHFSTVDKALEEQIRTNSEQVAALAMVEELLKRNLALSRTHFLLLVVLLGCLVGTWLFAVSFFPVQYGTVSARVITVGFPSAAVLVGFWLVLVWQRVQLLVDEVAVIRSLRSAQSTAIREAQAIQQEDIQPYGMLFSGPLTGEGL